MPINILLADDHTIFRSGLRVLLEKERDLKIIGECDGGIATLKAALDPNVDVLVLDISMPDLPGAKVAESLLRERPHLPIVILTMHENEYYLREFLKIGVKAFVLKKSTSSDLIQAIHKAYKGELYVAPELIHVMVSSYTGNEVKNVKSRLNILTPREQEVCRLVAYGYTNQEIASELYISERTVETHRANVMAKLELHSRSQLVRFAIDNDLFKLS